MIIVLGAVLLGFVLLAVVLLVASLVARTAGKNPRPLLWTGLGVLAIPVVAIGGLVVFAQLDSDPDTIELDLREPVRFSSLPDDGESFPGMRDYDSERISLVLPDGRSFEAEVDGVLISSENGYVTRISFDRRAREDGEAEALYRDWREGVGGAGVVEVEPDYSDHGRVRGEVLSASAP
ncbi:hypothetical protein GCM10010197_09960 [Nocardioides luteus]|nr:hypothetical protein GCM10010197_09960 [Nocardioides luteus]